VNRPSSLEYLLVASSSKEFVEHERELELAGFGAEIHLAILSGRKETDLLHKFLRQVL